MCKILTAENLSTTSSQCVNLFTRDLTHSDSQLDTSCSSQYRDPDRCILHDENIPCDMMAGVLATAAVHWESQTSTSFQPIHTLARATHDLNVICCRLNCLQAPPGSTCTFFRSDAPSQHAVDLVVGEKLRGRRRMSRGAEHTYVGDEILRGLASQVNLTCLNVGVPVTEEGVYELAGLSLLHTLHLHNYCPKDLCIGVKALRSLNSLRSVHLGHSYGVKIMDDGAYMLAQLSSLISLSICGSEMVTDRGVQILARLPTLRMLDLSRCTHISSISLVALAATVALTTLDLSFCSNITDAGVQVIAAALPELHTLILAHCLAISNVGVEALARVSTLRVLSIRGCSCVTDEGLKALSEHHLICTLNLGFCYLVTDQGVKFIVKGLPGLMDLSVHACNMVTDGSLMAVAELSAMRSLDISSCTQVSDKGIKAVVGCLPLLHTLHLKDCPKLTDSGVQAVTCLPNLKFLDCSGCYQITDQALEAIAEMSNLQTLRLSHCPKVTDEGVAALAALPALHNLNLSSNRGVSDKGVKALVGLRSLRYLHLSLCPRITDEGVLALADLPELHTLLITCSQDAIYPSKRKLSESPDVDGARFGALPPHLNDNQKDYACVGSWRL